jgi:hypothetical protein
MSDLALDAARMMEMLPESEQHFAFEFIKRLVRAWDPDFTKVTSEEAQQIALAEESGFVDESEIDWDSIGI